jgi:hypothetical protein
MHGRSQPHHGPERPDARWMDALIGLLVIAAAMVAIASVALIWPQGLIRF